MGYGKMRSMICRALCTLSLVSACAGPPQKIDCIVDEDCGPDHVCRQFACVAPSGSVLDAAGCCDADTGPVEVPRDVGVQDADVGLDGGTVGLDGGTGLEALFERHNIVFVTSRGYQPGALGGLEAADAICRSHADAAGLPRPNSYVALLSDGQTSAISRLITSRGWIRVDGLPFADRPQDISAGKIWYPVALSEVGLEPAVPLVASGTNGDLSSRGGSCQAWTSTSAGQVIPVGDSRDGTRFWLDYFEASLGERWTCDDFLGIYCFGTGMVEPLPPPQLPVGAKLAFQTMQTIASGGGIESFDALCQAEADDADLVGRTFISLTAPSTGRNVLSRLSTDDGPWYRRDGVKVAHDIRKIASDALIAPVNLDAQGENYQHRRILAGTIGTRNDALSCGNWMSSLGQTRIGKSGSSTRFFVGEFVPCSSSAHLLCFEVERR